MITANIRPPWLFGLSGGIGGNQLVKFTEAVGQGPVIVADLHALRQ